MIDYNDAVASFSDKASDVGNRDAELASQKLLQAQKARVDQMLANELTAMHKNGQASSEAYKNLLAETTALGRALNEAHAKASVASIKEERLELASLHGGSAEKVIAETDAKFQRRFISALNNRDGLIDVPMPAIAQNSKTGEIQVSAVKPKAAAQNGETSIEASLRQAQQITAAATSDFTIPSVVVDLLGFVVTYPRLFNKFRVYQTVGIETVNLNKIENIQPAEYMSTGTVRTGEAQDADPAVFKYGKTALRALKVGGTTSVTPELVSTLPADMLQERIASYLAESLGLRYADAAVNGTGGSAQAKGIVHWLNNEGTAQRVDGKATTSNVANIDRAEVAKLFSRLGGAYQSIVGNLTIAANSTTFWNLWSNIQEDYPLFSDSRSYAGQMLGPWSVCVDDALPNVANDNVAILAGDFMKAWAIRYGGALRLEVSRDFRFQTDEIVIKAVQHFDTQPAETKAVVGYRGKN